MNPPLFSVVTPTFNSGAKLARTAASVLSQAAGLYEFLVIDGGSTDDSLTSLDAKQGAVRWVSEPDQGVYDAMNKGIRLSRGKYLYFLGAGDCLRPGALRNVADRLTDKTDDRQFVYGDVNWLASGEVYGGEFDAFRLVSSNISHQAIFYGRGIFDLLGPFDLRYKICADHVMNIRCFGQRTIRKTHLDLVIADFEGGGISDTNIDAAFHADLAQLAWRHFGPIAALKSCYHYSDRLRLARWLAYHIRQPWSTLPSRFRRLVRRTFPGPP